jgi:uncharacterized membrane protein YfcA
MNHILIYLGIFLAGIFAGAVNSVAGGGSLISFPALVAFGIPAISANATNTAAIWPGSLSSAIAYSREIKPDRKLLLTLLLPSIVGGLLGAVVLVITPPALFGAIVPFLVLFATLLFASRGLLDRLIKRQNDESGGVTLFGRVWGFIFQFFVATYGGYFGAGIGIMMLGSFSIMGMRDIHKMNGLKTLIATMINIIAFIFFAFKGMVQWPIAAVMAAGTILGGFGGARIARHINQKYLRWFVILVGLSVSIWLYIK